MTNLLADAEAAAGAFPPLSLAHMPRNAQFPAGQRAIRNAGIGNDFWQFRTYSFGDPAQTIDWRQSARADTIAVREQERVAPHVIWLWSDPSHSMHFTSAANLPAKSSAANCLALAAAKLFCQAEEMVSVLGTSLPPRFSQQHWQDMAQALQTAPPAANLPLLDNARVSAKSFVILISDFGSDPGQLLTRLSDYARAGVIGCLVQMLDPLERDFPLTGRLRISGLEGEADELLDNAGAHQADYLTRLTALQTQLQDFCRAHHWGWLTLTTDQKAREHLAQLYNIIDGLTA